MNVPDMSAISGDISMWSMDILRCLKLDEMVYPEFMEDGTLLVKSGIHCRWMRYMECRSMQPDVVNVRPSLWSQVENQ